MNVDELRRLYRSRFDDADIKKYALSDVDFLMYLNEAQDRACASANLIFDRASAICSIDIEANTSVYTIDDSIHGIKHARVIDTWGVATPLAIISDERLDRIDSTWRDNSADLPKYLMHYHDKAELYPIPNDAYTLKLEVYRLGAQMTGDKDAPEIPRLWHSRLIDWILYRMYSMPDEDMHQPQKAQQAKQDFEATFGVMPSAKDYQDRYSDHDHHNTTTFI